MLRTTHGMSRVEEIAHTASRAIHIANYLDGSAFVGCSQLLGRMVMLCAPGSGLERGLWW